MDSESFAVLFPDLARKILARTNAADSPQAALELEERRREAAEQLRSIQALAQRLGARYAPDQVSLEDFVNYHAGQAAVLKQVKAIAGRVREFVEAGRGLVLYGSVGTGKDYLLAALLYAALESGLSADWVNGLEVFRAFRDAMTTDEQERAVLARFTKPAVLGMSDPLPPLGESNAWRTETLYRVLDARYREGRPTWVTVNVLSPEDADAKLSAPVFDRLRHDAELVKCFWPSYRERKS